MFLRTRPFTGQAVQIRNAIGQALLQRRPRAVALSDGTRRGAARRAAGENTAAEKSSLKRRIAVNPAPAEASHFAGRIETGDGFAIRTDHPAFEISLQTAQRLARENVKADRDQRARRRIEQPMRPHGAKIRSPR